MLTLEGSSVASLYLYFGVMPSFHCTAGKAFQQVSVGQGLGGVFGPSAVRKLVLSTGVRTLSRCDGMGER